MKSSARLEALRQVLRNLDRPERLRENALVGWQFQGRTTPANAAVRIRHTIEQALGDLSERQRDIVRHCDLEGEPHARAIARLAISERHFYRERHAAAERLSAALSCTSESPALDASDDESLVTLPLCFAESAQQIGDLRGGLQVLHDAEKSSLKLSDRLRLECRLAELYGESGALGDAATHLEVARRIAAQLPPDAGVSQAVVSAVEAAAAWFAGNVEGAVHAAALAVDVLRGALTFGDASYQSEALALGLLVLSEADAWSGRWTTARRGALEARDVLLACNSLRGVLIVRAQLTATDAYMLDPACIYDAAAEYRRLYRDAISRGLSLEATVIGCRLALFHRFASAPQLAAGALERILPIARHLLTLEDRAQICLDLASAYADCGKTSMARELIVEARAHALPQGFSLGLCDLLASDICLQERHYDAALSLSAKAKDAMQRLGRRGAVGSALRIQAEAHHAIGNNRLARNFISDAIADTESAGHLYVVAKVHLSAARITGKSVHRRRAKELFSTLRRTAGASSSCSTT
jgi:hypothetical protein